MLTITHTHESGTLIDGTTRGDGTAEVLKANRWRWGRSINAWFVPNSRDRLPKMSQICATREALEAAGFTVELDVSTERRNMAEVEADRIERQAARVDALEAKAERKSAAEDAAYSRARQAFDSLPEGGEPVKVGHHSEGRHRAAIAKADAAMRRSVDAGDVARDARAKADAATHTTDARYEPGRVARRIETLEREGRKLARALTITTATNTVRLQLLADENTDQLEYWRTVRATQIAEGKTGDYTPQTIAKGDLVAYRFGDTAIVTRVNPKTVTVAYWPRWDAGRMATDTIAYGNLTGHTVPSDEQRTELLAKAKTGAAQNKAAHAAALASFAR